MEVYNFIIENKVLTIVILFLIYNFFQNHICKKNIEKMSNTDNIKEEINKIYKADIQSIRNLSVIAKKLQAGELVIPGNVKILGKLNVDKQIISKDDITCNKNMNIDGETRIKKLISDGEIESKSIKCKENITIFGDLKSTGKISGNDIISSGNITSNGSIHGDILKSNKDIYLGNNKEIISGKNTIRFSDSKGFIFKNNKDGKLYFVNKYGNRVYLDQNGLVVRHWQKKYGFFYIVPQTNQVAGSIHINNKDVATLD